MVAVGAARELLVISASYRDSRSFLHWRPTYCGKRDLVLASWVTYRNLHAFPHSRNRHANLRRFTIRTSPPCAMDRISLSILVREPTYSPYTSSAADGSANARTLANDAITHL
ncbi:hypothetical protein VTK73DRAFT_8873 [Phialemonium thermophilum]|uniref:Uncharacterized protein n=1 Tax=Phialemonium thermophilum TaxID=223376 RepID=A0ABR3W5I8_9PEZI